MLEIMKYLAVDLPVDVQKTIDCGDFARAEVLIDKYMHMEGNEAVKKRLMIEKEIMRRLPLDYPYTEEEALRLVQKEITDFTMQELRQWENAGGADWCFIDHQVHLQKRFFASMKKVYPDIARRAGMPVSSSSLLDDNILDMQKNGKAAYRFTITHSIRIRDDVFHPGEVLVHLPLPAVCQNMKDIEIHGFSQGGVTDREDSLCRTISFREYMQENHAFQVKYSYTSTVDYKDLFSARQICTDTEMRAYTCEEYPQIRFTPAVQELCMELSKGENDPLRKAWNFYRYCTEQVRYSFMPSYLTIPCIPDYLANQRIGDCGVMALLFITLCRCAGIPAHWQSGMYVTPETIGNHDWAMFYVEPYGWCFADPSFGNSAFHAGNITRQKYYFGNLDPFRMAANNAFMQEMNPPKSQWRNDPYDNQSGEIEYTDERGLISGEFETERVLNAWQKIV